MPLQARKVTFVWKMIILMMFPRLSAVQRPNLTIQATTCLHTNGICVSCSILCPKSFMPPIKRCSISYLNQLFFEQFGINCDLVQLWQEIVLDSLRGGHQNILVKRLKSDSAVLRAFFSKPIVQRILFDQYLWQAYFRYPHNDKHWQFGSTSPYILTCFDDVFVPMFEKNSSSNIFIINEDTQLGDRSASPPDSSLIWGSSGPSGWI